MNLNDLEWLNGYFTLNFHYYETARFESIFTYLVQSVYIGVSRVTSGDAGSGVADCDPQNIWNPRKMRIFRIYIVGILTSKATISI